MILVGAVFGGGIALALRGHDMDQDRALFAVPHVFQHRDEMIEIVPVDRADVVEPKLFEHRPAGHHAAGVFFGLLETAPHPAAHLACDARCHGAQTEIFAAGHHAREIGGQPANGRRDGHVVVVEDHDQPVAGLFGIVHRFIGHAGAHRAVTDHGDAAPRAVLHLVGHGKAQRSRNRGRAVRSTERIVFAFRALGEAAEPAALAQGADTVAAPGQDLVRIALVPDVPHQLVFRRIENIVDRRGQFDHAQTRSQMATGLADRVDHFGTQFVGELPQLVLAELAEIVWGIDRIEQRRLRATCHNMSLYTHITRLSTNGWSLVATSAPPQVSRRNRRTDRAARPRGAHR